MSLRLGPFKIKTTCKLFALILVALSCINSSRLIAPAYADCAPLASDKGQVANTVTVPTAGTYTLWIRLDAPDAGRNSVYVQIDDNCSLVAGDDASGGYVWVDYQDGDKTKVISLDLTAGQHTIKLAGRETEAAADKIMLLADTCVPTGMGTNCPAANAAANEGGATGVSSHDATVDSTFHRHWWIICSCIGVAAAAAAILVWKYVAFMRVRPFTEDHSNIVVGTGLPAHTNHWEVLRDFTYHHRRLLATCGGLIVLSVVVGVVAAVETLPVAEVESGALSGNVSVASDSAASGGKLVVFGTTSGTVAGSQGSPGSGGGKAGSGSSGGSGSGSSGGASEPSSLNLPRIAWEGGPSYYANFSKATAWNNPNFFPVGVWFESVTSSSDTSKDLGAGLNTYFELTDNSNTALIRNAGMYAFPSAPLANYGSETVGWEIQDEADMDFGAGNDAWDQNYSDTVSTWNSCIPKQDNGGKCGYTADRTLISQLPGGGNDGRLIYQNYGKGLTFWDSDNEASGFLNVFPTVASNDLYWYTDPNVCSSSSEGPSIGAGGSNCRWAANYGWTMDRMRAVDAIDGKRQPIYAFIEDGCPFSDGGCINANQIGGAVMSSLIHEARGIIYFNHNFGSSCISQHVLRDSCGSGVRPTVASLNNMIKDLAPVLNTQSYQYSFNGSLDTMLKGLNGTYYIFAMQKRGHTSGSYTFTLPAGLNASSVQLPYEGGRSIPVSGGKFTDSFAAEYSYHVYKVIP